jgi:hypothetical protein
MEVQAKKKRLTEKEKKRQSFQGKILRKEHRKERRRGGAWRYMCRSRN